MRFFKKVLIPLLFFSLFFSCRTLKSDFYLGADLSYVNEMEDSGARYRLNGEVTDPYKIFHKINTNLVRIRLWHNPSWTEYSTLDDEKKSIKRAHQNQMAVLLDFHFSDTWADPSKQNIPKAWKAKNHDEIVTTLYEYTCVNGRAELVYARSCSSHS
ncbi:MAG: glycosyl hydrolase 53 family protein [Spirochaetaceae bacterium]|jgi:arabinogalactan endo-1,4-beta-galactosidase|nr:glycosyl hydrolase 53 family protein [Spirochaetaceae bacterium]